MPIALGALAFASCSENDFLGNEEIQLADNQIIATVEQAFDDVEGATRGAMGEFGNEKSFVWAEGDKAKVYAAKNWRTDIYTVTEASNNCTKAIFTSTERVDKTDMAYGVYPAGSGATEVTVNEARSELTVNLPSVVSYAKLADAHYGDAESTNTGTAYRCDRPMFGFVVDQNIKYRYLTSVLRVVVESALPTAAKYLVVYSPETEDKLSGKFTADIEKISNDFFDDNTKGASYDIPALKGAADAKNWVCVDLTEAKDYDNNIYIPIPAQTYAGPLAVYICNSTFDPKTYDGASAPTGSGVICDFTSNATGSTKESISAGAPIRTYAADKEFKTTLVYTVGTIHGPATLTSSATTLKQLNEELAALNIDRDVTIDIPNAITSFDVSVLGTKLDATQLNIPDTWAGEFTVTLNFNGDDNSLLSDGVTDYNAGGVTVKAKPVVINNLSSINNVIINVKNAEDTKDVTVDVKESANSLTTLGTNVEDITVTAGKIAINNNVQDVNLINTAATAITIEKGVINAFNAKTAPLTVNDGTLKAVTVENGAVTINGGTITTLTLTKDKAPKITMTGGEVERILETDVFTTETTIPVVTSGAAVWATDYIITDVNAKFTYTSTWNNKTDLASATAQGNIYTAAQLKAASGASDLITKYTLYTDVTIDASATFASIDLNDAVNTFDGNSKTITGITAPLFAAIEGDDIIIQDLTIANPAIKTAMMVGAVAPKITNNTTLERIAVTGATIGAGWTFAESSSANVGGLIGQFNPDITDKMLTITDCSVEGTVQGYYNLGGFIGSVDGTGAKVIIGKSAGSVAANSNVTLKKTYWKSDKVDDKCGTVGNFIGSVLDEVNTITIGDNTNATSFSAFFGTNQGINATTIATATYDQANNGWLEFARNSQGAGKVFAGPQTGNYEIGYSNVDKVPTLYGATKYDSDNDGDVDTEDASYSLKNFQ